MSLTYTYKWQPQPYVSWKGPSTNSATKIWSRPLENGPPSNDPNTRFPYGPAFKARPIKSWRKQLNPRSRTGYGARAGVGMPMDIPGGSTYLGSTSSNCLNKECKFSYALKENLAKDPANTIILPGSDKTLYDKDSQKTYCIQCNPENNVIKYSAQTIVNKNYYTDSRAYLQSRNKLYKQNLGVGSKFSSKPYFSPEGQPLLPSNNPDIGPPNYKHRTCCLANCINTNKKCNTYIYKPSNPTFAVEGPVSSSTNILRKKINTINKNAVSFQNAWGLATKNESQYAGSFNNYTLKSRFNKCIPKRIPGNPTNCFFTPTADN